MDVSRYRMPLSLVVLVAWVAITAFSGRLLYAPAPGNHQIVEGVSGGIAWPILLAGLFLVAVLFTFRWFDLGFRAPIAGSLRLLWLPAIFIAGFILLALFVGLPPPDMIAFLAINALLVGFSEELMFRGVLFQGMRSRLAVWPAIWTTSVLFGVVHVLNALTTGEWLAASTQAATAFMSGLMFLAILIRTGSILPGMILHAVWDFTLLLSAAGAMGAGHPQGDVPPALLLVPLAFTLPNFLYALYLLRKVRNTDLLSPG